MPARRHPALAFNGRDILFAWTEGMGWNKGGGLAWQIYDANGQPGKEERFRDHGRADGVPVWSLITAVPHKSDQFMIIY